MCVKKPKRQTAKSKNPRRGAVLQPPSPLAHRGPTADKLAHAPRRILKVRVVCNLLLHVGAVGGHLYDERRVQDIGDGVCHVLVAHAAGGRRALLLRQLFADVRVDLPRHGGRQREAARGAARVQHVGGQLPVALVRPAHPLRDVRPRRPAPRKEVQPAQVHQLPVRRHLPPAVREDAREAVVKLHIVLQDERALLAAGADALPDGAVAQRAPDGAARQVHPEELLLQRQLEALIAAVREHAVSVQLRGVQRAAVDAAHALDRDRRGRVREEFLGQFGLLQLLLRVLPAVRAAIQVQHVAGVKNGTPRETATQHGEDTIYIYIFVCFLSSFTTKNEKKNGDVLFCF
ncbi:glycosyltransferase family-like protein [Strigomonas culicis]|uniref:Glycosyltransferase family-like protein n=1 Tax=Strigomonas culicis TaxID=28005 RepID=S9WLP0_9TRYP|nr:glycosyltransferase family-like protein [Strigomonas culicis]|eukprot:EPY36905.1 glycosyltransferase family-like protein [Strigomonas culicis]